MKQISTKLKIVFILGLSFLIVRAIAPRLFIADSPRINPLFVAQLLNLPTQLAGLIRGNSTNVPGQVYQGEQTVSQVNVPRATEPIPQNSVIYQIGKGAYAAEDKETKKTYIMFKADAKVKVYEYKLPSGKSITLYEPIQ